MLAVTLFPTSFIPCLTPEAALEAAPATALPADVAAPLAAEPTLLATLPKPLFALAASVLGLSNGNSCCAPFCLLGSAYLGSSIHKLSGPTSANLSRK